MTHTIEHISNMFDEQLNQCKLAIIVLKQLNTIRDQVRTVLESSRAQQPPPAKTCSVTDNTVNPYVTLITCYFSKRSQFSPEFNQLAKSLMISLYWCNLQKKL